MALILFKVPAGLLPGGERGHAAVAGGAPAHGDQAGAHRLRLQRPVRQVPGGVRRHAQEQAAQARLPGGQVGGSKKFQSQNRPYKTECPQFKSVRVGILLGLYAGLARLAILQL